MVRVYLTLPRRGPGPEMTVSGVSASHQNKPKLAPGTGFRRVPFLLSRTTGLENSESYVQDITFLKNKPWYQRAHVFLLRGATHPCAVRGRAKLGYLCQRWMLSAGTWTSSNSSAWLLSPRKRVCRHGERSGCAAGGVWPALGCRPRRSGVRKQGQNKPVPLGSLALV